MKMVLLAGALLVTSASALANPWDVVPPTPPYKSEADAVKAATPPGQPSNLNPSCAGMTGDACIRSQESYGNSAPAPAVKPAASTERG
jgi:hypothetical protein